MGPRFEYTVYLLHVCGFVLCVSLVTKGLPKEPYGEFYLYIVTCNNNTTKVLHN
ncbi:hypothetical protein P167DRAFT_539427 [Morchella conica CCBAS932]|uniref:Uncharacterized protein n=1 Tax=Morchella conica CCBAS932 TaxID=1392247 RepID=A0A3N4KFU9_9PEZI|nr:hypothetical protein P167DRAFT_539427 [Morchella conica CCBAS932]